MSEGDRAQPQSEGEIQRLRARVAALEGAEAALKASEQRFRLATQSLSDVVYEWDLKEQVDWYGDVDGLMGYPPGGFPRTLAGWAATLHPDDQARVLAAVEAQLAGTAPYDVEYRARRHDGGWRWWQARGVVVRNEQGEPSRWIGSITDVTERRQAEESLRESEARYRSVVENIPQEIFMKDRGSRWVSVNERFARGLGLRPADVVGKVDDDFFPPELADKYRADDRRIMETGQTDEFDEEYVEGDRRRVVHTIKTPVRDDHGAIVGVLGVFTDITERARMEASLRESEERSRATLYGIGDGVIATDAAGRVMQMNPVAEALTGWPEAEAQGRPLAEVFRIINEGSRAEVESPVARVLREGTVVGLANHTLLIAKDGTERPIADSGAPIRDERGEITGVVLVFRDRTEERVAEQALRASERKFRDTVRYLDEGYYSCTMDGLLLEHNVAFNRLLGFDVAQDLKGSKLPDFWQNPDDREAYLTELMGTGVARNYLIDAKTIGGEKLVVMANSHVVKDDQGRPVRIEGTFTDFTERQRMEEALRAGEARYRATLDGLLEGCQILGFDWRYLYLNDAVERHGRRPKEELLGKTMMEMWPGIVDTHAFAVERRCMEERIAAQLENEFTFPDGTRGWFELAIQPVPEGIAIWSVDITERKRAEARERHLNQVLRSIRSINQLIVREHAPRRLIEQACELLVETRSYGGAWIALEGERGAPHTWAQAGLGDAFAPFASALQEGRWPPCRDRALESASGLAVLDPCATCTCSLGTPSGRERSVVALLRHGGRTLGMLGVALPREVWVDDEEVALLLEVTADLAFALNSIEVEGERKLAGQALRLKNLVFDASIAAESIADPGGVLTEVNAAFLRTWGYASKGEVVGRPIAEFLHHSHEALPIITGLNQSGEWAGEYTARRKDGSTFAALGLATVLRNETGELLGYQSAVVDITERKRAEEALKISQERLLFATEGANLGVWHWDTVSGELIWSDKCKALFGIPLDETMSYPRFSAALHPDDRERTDKAVKDALDRHEDYDIEYRSRWPDGSIHWLAAKGRGYYDATGKAPRLEGVVLDITERKRAQDDLRQANDQLEQRVRDRTARLEESNQELEAFSYSVSHDLRAPLRAIDGFTRILAKEYEPHLNHEGQRICSVIRDNTRSMSRLIDDLLAFSRLGRAEMSLSPIDMEAMATALFHEVTTPEGRERIDFRVGAVPPAIGDPTLMRQVWMNLLANAVKFSAKRERAVIEVRGGQREGEAVYSVTDNGAGFDMRYADKLFGVFQRLHSTSEFEGTGVGLALVQRVVRRHGGRVWAEGEIDRGATFHFALPQKGA
jgi:PAS domain S-box-containing protein